MGSPKKQRKKFSKPSHPWQKERILAEHEIVKEYGLNRKYEIWKMNSILKNMTRQAKNLIATKKPQAQKEAMQLLTKLHSLGLINKDAQIEDVLSLSLKDIMERRLQTLVYRKSLASSARQARQFIVHEHIALGEKTITAPSYLVPVDEEGNIGFSRGSALSNTSHPQRSAISEVKAGKRKEKQGKKESSDKAEKKKEETQVKEDNKAEKTEKKDHADKGNKQKKKEEGK